MRRIKSILLLLIATFMFVPYINVNAESGVVQDIGFDCGKTTVTMNENLAPFEITNKTEGITIVPYDGENTKWVQRKESDTEWTDFGSQDPVVDSESKHYGLRVKVTLNDGWGMEEDLSLTFNGVKYNVGLSGIEKVSGGAYVTIDLGKPTNGADPATPVQYTFTADFNGGAPLSDELQIPEVVEEGEELYLPVLGADMLRAPKLKEFDAFLVNGERVEGDSFITITGDTLVSIIWKDAEPEDYVVEEEYSGIIFEFTESTGIDFSIYIDYLSLYTDEFIEENIPEEYREEFIEDMEESKAFLTEQVADLGDLLDFYMIYLVDEYESEYHEGPFIVKIPVTEEMKKYNKFLMVYFTEDLEPTEEMVEFKIEGDYLVGELPHLSNFALVGTYEEEATEEPATGDNVVLFIILALTSTAGLFSVRTLRRN